MACLRRSALRRAGVRSSCIQLSRVHTTGVRPSAPCQCLQCCPVHLQPSALRSSGVPSSVVQTSGESDPPQCARCGVRTSGVWTSYRCVQTSARKLARESNPRPPGPKSCALPLSQVTVEERCSLRAGARCRRTDVPLSAAADCIAVVCMYTGRACTPSCLQTTAHGSGVVQTSRDHYTSVHYVHVSVDPVPLSSLTLGALTQ